MKSIYSEIITTAAYLLSQIAIAMPLITEIIKNLFGDEKIEKIFGSKQVFAAFCSSVIAIVTIIGLALFTPSVVAGLNAGQAIFASIVFVILSIGGSQTSYDKIIKYLLSLIKKD